MQIPGRTPANTAMTAATLDLLSGGRFLLGLGTSGPQVVEGWHGEPWGKPLAKTREYVEIVRTVLRRETLEHHGSQYEIPFSGNGATGLGKPLKLMLRPLRAEIPIYLAAISPKAIELAFEIGDGWIPLFFSPERAREVFASRRPRARRVRHRGDGARGCDGRRAVGRDALKPYYALYIGGMGARGKNFYNSLFARYGYEDEAREIQDLFLDGKQRDAAAKVPDAFVDDVALVGLAGADRRPARRVARVGRDFAARLGARREYASRRGGGGGSEPVRSRAARSRSSPAAAAGSGARWRPGSPRRAPSSCSARARSSAARKRPPRCRRARSRCRAT